MAIRICGIGVVSSLGIGAKANFEALLAEKAGITACQNIATSVAVPVGEIKMSNDQLKTMLGIPPSHKVSRTALLGAIAAREAIKDASIAEDKRVGLISSTTVGGMDLSEDFYVDYIKDSSKGRLRDVVGHDCSVSTEFIARQCEIKDFSTTISTACSSSINAIHLGVRMIKAGILDYVVVGGCDSLCRFTINGFNSLSILDNELCCPLDKNRKGLNLGEGAGYIVLTADEQSHKTYCYLGGCANANDAYHQTASSENGDGAYLAMNQALELSSLRPQDIDYINLHGTGTQNNDLSELRAMRRLFGDTMPPFSSTKSFTGHTLAAAGGLEAVYSVLSISNGVRYANLRYKSPIEGDIVPITKIQIGVEVNNVMSNSFGFGGNCSSVVFMATPPKINEENADSTAQFYVNCLKKDTQIKRDIKELVPNMNMRRRMSKVLKMGVLTALDSLLDFEEFAPVDAIVTATWLGCIGDSEKFLANLIRDDEKLLNPTPFIQSTFNTIGGQVAMIRNMKCYNNTFTHAAKSMESALLDAKLLLQNGDAKAVLLGLFDESSDTVKNIYKRLNIKEDAWEGAVFFVLTKEKYHCSQLLDSVFI